MKTIIKTALFLSISLAAVTAAFAAPQKPSDAGVPWNLGNFTPSSNPNNRMPDPDLRMSAQPYAYPTNRWWGSTYITNPDFGTANPPYSTMMFLGPASIRFFNAQSSVVGVRLTAPNVAITNSNERVSGIASNTGFLQLSISSNPVMDPNAPYTPYSINPSSLTVTNFSDWAVTAEMRDTVNPDLKMTATFVKGGVFTYVKFSAGTYPDLRFGWMTWDYAGNDVTDAAGSIRWKSSYGGAIIRQNGQWFAVYLPEGSTYSKPAQDQWSGWCYWGMRLIFPPDAEEEERYVIIAYLGNQTMYPAEDDVMSLFLEYRKYAYNLITDTKVTWEKNDDSSITTAFKYATTALPKRPAGDFVEEQTLFSLYPHQWRYLAQGTPLTVSGSQNPEYTTIRGKLKVYKGDSFKTRYEFNGMLPSLTYEVPEADRLAFENYIAADNSFSIAGAANDTYRKGKALAKAANLIPVFHQAGKIAERDLMKEKVKEELKLWYEGSGGRSLAYDNTWGGIIGSPSSFGTQLYSDHHFHYGYFVYASAVLAMYDSEFASNYKGIVDLLIRNFASPYKHNDIKFQERSFPFLRNFDVYGGQSWASGRGASSGDWGGGTDDGNDQESISEAMNAWSGIYLWGIMTDNDDWVKLGMYGYTTESKAAEEYYFDIHNQTYPSAYAHRGGILFDNSLRYYTHWEYEGTVNPKPTTKQERYGIWILPLTPSMLYMGYNPSAAEDYYNRMLNDPAATNDPAVWRDIFLRYKSLFNAPGALTDWNSQPITAEEGSSLSYSYHFINFFNALGTVSTDYYALDEWNRSVPFTVMKKSNGEYTFIAYNNSDNEKKIKFFPRAGSSLPNSGEMTIPPKVIAQTKDFQSLKYDLIPSEITVTPSTNTALNVYSIFSDNFLGAVIDGHIYNDPYNDALTLDLWKEGNISTVEITFSSSSASPEGINCLSAKRTYADWGGWGFKFAGGAMDMSSFYDGKIEVSIKIDSASDVAENFEIGFETAFGPVWFTLKSLGFNQNSTGWQAVSIPLSDQYITERSLRYVTTPFMMNHAGTPSRSLNGLDIPVNISSVLWKKSDTQLSANFSAELKNRDGSEPASVIGWTPSDFRQRYAVAQQYIEIGLNNTEGNSWCLQIYTDNTGDDLQYGGNISSDTVSGLVNISGTNTAMIPMMWRADQGIFDLSVSSRTLVNDDGDSGLMVWGALRDVAAFSDTPGSLGYGSDEIIIWDRQGFKWDQWSMQRGVPVDDKKVRIYFLADFRNAQKGVIYKSNIVIEYFNE